MNTLLADASLIEPGVFRRYLRARSWSEQPSQNPRAHRYVRDLDGTHVEVEVPARARYADYARRIGELLETIAAAERRDVQEILWSLRRPESDVVRFRVEGPDTATGTIRLEDAIRLREGRKRMLLAVAHTVVEPMPHFARLSRTAAVEFVDSCREAPAQPGSYVSEVLVPVSPALGASAVHDPFARRATVCLARALARTAAALDAGDDEDLLRGAVDGISSNFLAGLASVRPSSGLIEVSLDWAATRRVPEGLKTAVARFSPEVFGTLEEAARVLRDSFELPGYELEGFICALARDEEDAAAPGQVEVATTLEERTAKVRFALPAELYAVATEAHRTAARIRVVGTLVKQGRRLTLRHPEGFVVLGDDEALAD